MATALGIFIEGNLIKYSKVSTTKDKIRIESYGVKYFTNISKSIDQIINETNSDKIPIVVNSVDPDYNYFNIFAKLNERDYGKSIDLQFEEVTTESSVNKNLLQTGYLLSPNPQDSEKLHVLHVSQYLTAMDTRANLFKSNKPSIQIPTSLVLNNLLNDLKPYVILNLEENTELTAVLNKIPYEVKSFKNGISQMVKQINQIENSIPKSYEVLKNTVVPISESDHINMEENEYIPNILVEFNELIEELKRYLETTPLKIKKMYLTGTGATISNIELLFKESLPGLEVEILKPFFLPEASLNISIKEYIDVNSATALALEELGFSKGTLMFKSGLSRPAGMNFNVDIKDLDFSELGETIKDSFKAEISPFESFSIRLGLTSLIVLILFIAVSISLTKSNREKLRETSGILLESETSLTKIESDISKVKTKTDEYEALLMKMDESSGSKTDSMSFVRKDALPNFLNQIAHLIPVRVKVTDIKEERSHITITLESPTYEQLGYFVGLLENEGVLMKIKTSTSQKEGNVVKLVVEGDLPWESF